MTEKITKLDELKKLADGSGHSGKSRFFSHRLRHQAYLRNPKISRVHFGYNVGIQLGIWLHRANADLRHGVVKDAP